MIAIPLLSVELTAVLIPGLAFGDDSIPPLWLIGSILFLWLLMGLGGCLENDFVGAIEVFVALAVVGSVQISFVGIGAVIVALVVADKLKSAIKEGKPSFPGYIIVALIASFSAFLHFIIIYQPSGTTHKPQINEKNHLIAPYRNKHYRTANISNPASHTTKEAHARNILCKGDIHDTHYLSALFL